MPLTRLDFRGPDHEISRTDGPHFRPSCGENGRLDAPAGGRRRRPWRGAGRRRGASSFRAFFGMLRLVGALSSRLREVFNVLGEV